jgi:hypothetical protein
LAVVRADAAFAKPELYEAFEERSVKYAIHIPSNGVSVFEQAAERRPGGRVQSAGSIHDWEDDR